MKIASQFRAFLESFHYLVLPQLGKIETVSTEINPLTGEMEKKILRFTRDKHIPADAEFICYISERLKINKSIAESDLNSFCSSLKELLRQGFEAEIPGIGFLHMEGQHEMKFSGKSIYNAVSLQHKKRIPVILHTSFWF